jgi:hypothetical protein
MKYHMPTEGKPTDSMVINIPILDHCADNMLTSSSRVCFVSNWDESEKRRIANATMAISGIGMIRAILLNTLVDAGSVLEQTSNTRGGSYTNRSQRRKDNKHNYKK